MQEAIRFLSNLFDIPRDVAVKLLGSLLVILLLWFLRFLVLRIVRRRSDSPVIHYKWKKNSVYATVLIGILIIGRIWFEAFQSLATFFGLLSAGLAVALRDPITDLAAWLFIIWRRPFEIGDRIEIGDNRGDVIDQRVFKFTINEIGKWVDADQSTGRIIHVPNHSVFTDPVINYNSRQFRFIWHEIPVLITFESDWKTTKSLLLDIAKKRCSEVVEEAQRQLRLASREFMIHYNVLTPTVYTDVQDSGVRLTLRYLTDPRKRRGMQETIWEDILSAFKEYDNIDLAYPTTRMYQNWREGKPGTKPEGS